MTTLTGMVRPDNRLCEMEDLVAVAVQLASGEDRFFMTWGRIQDPVDPEPLEALILRRCSKFALGGEAVSARMCRSLQEAAGAPYFFEALFSFSQQPIPFGPRYEAWRKRMAERMEKGKELYFLGAPRPKPAESSM